MQKKHMKTNKTRSHLSFPRENSILLKSITTEPKTSVQNLCKITCLLYLGNEMKWLYAQNVESNDMHYTALQGKLNEITHPQNFI